MARLPSRPQSSEQSVFRFCPFCGTQLEARKKGDRTRPTCPACGFRQFRNPVVGVAAVVWEKDLVACLGEDAVARGLLDSAWRPHPLEPRVLLARRYARIGHGDWCLPCGYVEFDEEVREALAREMLEETGLTVEVGEILAVQSNFHDPDRQSVGIWFQAVPTGGKLAPGDDVDGLGLFPPADPQVPLAFPTDALLLTRLGDQAGT
jgi:8-oxo-dGTP diphosphatase